VGRRGLSRLGRRTEPASPPAESAESVENVGPRDTTPRLVAQLQDGPLAGRKIDTEAVEGRPPKTIDVAADDGGTCRYCLAEWNQSGLTAAYTFLYRL